MIFVSYQPALQLASKLNVGIMGHKFKQVHKGPLLDPSYRLLALAGTYHALQLLQHHVRRSVTFIICI